MDAIFRDLTDPQREAVTHVDGPLLILAGPGSGKTRVVTHRIAHLLGQGIPTWQIAALTFTNKAADEMRQRVESLAPGHGVWMGTFHRFCAQLLRRYASLVGLKENYSIYDTSDAKAAMKRAITAADVSTSHVTPESIAATIGRAKNRLITPEMFQGQSMRADDRHAARVYPIYQQQLLLANAVDFDDLLLHVAVLLRENSEIRHDLDAKFKYIMVDEYQDTNLAQYAIVRALSIDHPNLAVTGDPDQSIYGWRGADINNILDFEKDYPDVRTVRLEQNYRSTPNILRAADQLIRHNRRRKQKRLFTENDEGEPVRWRLFEDGYQEADSIVDEIAAAIATQGMRPNDFAIFCRINALTRSLEHAMRRRGLPYQIVSGLEFYQRREVKDLLAYLHLLNNPAHDVALLRIINTPTRGIGAKTIQRVSEFADSHRITMLEAARRAAEIESLNKRAVTLLQKFVVLYESLAVKATASLADLLQHVVEQTGYESYLEKTADEQQDNDRMANVSELITAAVEFDRLHGEDGSLDAFLEQVALVSDTDAFEQTQERVTMMTLHAAKGLEFPWVYIIAVEEGLLPHLRSSETEGQIEEERRLLFVGITRAMQRLQLSCCKRRPFRGDLTPAIASRFVSELPMEEMWQMESVVEREWFDVDAYDEPDAWDLPDVTQVQEMSSETDEWGGYDVSPEAPIAADDDDCSQEPEPARRSTKTKKKMPLSVELTTAAAMLNQGTAVSLSTYQEGTQVRHDDYGEGVIVAVTGRGPKRTARVRFADGEHNFRLVFAKLEVLRS